MYQFTPPEPFEARFNLFALESARDGSVKYHDDMTNGPRIMSFALGIGDRAVCIFEWPENTERTPFTCEYLGSPGISTEDNDLLANYVNLYEISPLLADPRCSNYANLPPDEQTTLAETIQFEYENLALVALECYRVPKLFYENGKSIVVEPANYPDLPTTRTTYTNSEHPSLVKVEGPLGNVNITVNLFNAFKIYPTKPTD